MLEIYNETCFINNRCMHPAVSPLHAYRLQLVTEYGSRDKQQVEIIPLSTPKILSSL